MMKKPKIAGYKPVRQVLEPGIYTYCTCGLSSAQPFCDWSCRGTDWEPLYFTIEERQQLSLCTCKQTVKAPYCNGAHKELTPPEEMEESAKP